MTSIGHQVAPFDTLAGLAPAASQQIATAAGPQERGVRKWLGATNYAARTAGRS